MLCQEKVPEAWRKHQQNRSAGSKTLKTVRHGALQPLMKHCLMIGMYIASYREVS